MKENLDKILCEMELVSELESIDKSADTLRENINELLGVNPVDIIFQINVREIKKSL
jgi:hypothetical protein